MTAVALAALLAALPDLHVHPQPQALDLSARDVVTERNTQVAIVAAVVLLLALEYAIVRERDGGHNVPTISQVLEEWGAKFGTLPWTVGVLAGHWFWTDGRATDPRRARQDAMVLGWITLGVVAWDVIDHSGRDRSRAPALLVGGVVAGHLFWSQPPR